MKLPQKVLAYELGLDETTFSKIESGSTDLKFNIFIFLCERLKLNAVEFLT